MTTSRNTPTDSEWHAHMSKCLAKLSRGQREDFLERAAIMEYDGGLDRKDAARRAWRIVVQGLGDEVGVE